MFTTLTHNNLVMRAEQERCSARLTTRKLRASWKPPSGILAALPVMLSTIYLSSIRLPVFKTRLGNFSRTLFHEAWNSLHSSVLYTHKSLRNHVSLRTTHAWSPRKAARVVSVVFAGKKFARCNNISRLEWHANNGHTRAWFLCMFFVSHLHNVWNSFNRKTELLWKVHSGDIEELILASCPISLEKVIDENLNRSRYESAVWTHLSRTSKKIEILRGCCSGLLLPGSKRSPNEFHLAMTNHMSFVRLFFTWDLSLRKANIVPPNERPLNEIVYGDLRIDVCETHGLIVLPPRWKVFMCLNNYFFGTFFRG